MWKPADLSTVPTRSDLKHAKEAIDALEHELEKARRGASKDQPELQDSIARMVKDLEERKAWISPIRLLTFATLSLIFEFSSKADWKAPIRIGAICRTWRSAVLATPRAWTQIQLGLVSNHQRSLYLERSGQFPLHVGLGDYVGVAGVAAMAHRIQCMAIDDLPPIGEDICFPNLTRMELGYGEGVADPQLLTKQRFPALRHLAANTLFIHDSGMPFSPMPQSFPPIQTLWLGVDWSPAWLDVLQGCKESLTELGIQIDDFQDTWSLGGHPIHMPRLKFLHVDYVADSTAEPLKLTTPALRTYIESTHNDVPCGVAAEKSRVTHLQTDGIPTLASTTHLRVLQLRIPLDRLEFLLEQLRSSDHCPDLQTIEIMFIPKVTAQDKIRIVESWKEINRPDVDFRIFADKWSVEFSNGFSGSCGTQMPCRR